MLLWIPGVMLTLQMFFNCAGGLLSVDVPYISRCVFSLQVSLDHVIVKATGVPLFCRSGLASLGPQDPQPSLFSSLWTA